MSTIAGDLTRSAKEENARYLSLKFLSGAAQANGSAFSTVRDPRFTDRNPCCRGSLGPERHELTAEA